MARTPEEIFARLAPELLRMPGVRAGRMYGSSPRGLTVNGKMFALLSDGLLIVKLPRERVEELSASGVGRPHQPAGGKVATEWMAVDATASRRWRSLMVEAQQFVGSKAGSRSARKRRG